MIADRGSEALVESREVGRVPVGMLDRERGQERQVRI
jgi:hypothetical protein